MNDIEYSKCIDRSSSRNVITLCTFLEAFLPPHFDPNPSPNLGIKGMLNNASR